MFIDSIKNGFLNLLDTSKKDVIKATDEIKQNKDKELILALSALSLASIAGLGLYGVGKILENRQQENSRALEVKIKEDKTYLIHQYAAKRAQEVVDKLAYDKLEKAEIEGKEIYKEYDGDELISYVKVDDDKTEITIIEKSDKDDKTRLIICDNLGHVKEIKDGHKKIFGTVGQKVDRIYTYNENGPVAYEEGCLTYLDKETNKVINKRKATYPFHNGKINGYFKNVEIDGNNFEAQETYLLNKSKRFSKIA